MKEFEQVEVAAPAEVAAAATRKAWQAPTMDVVPARSAETDNAGSADSGFSS
ncbi:hypothetical protein [Ancylobacter lacus]|uniref:hypothetical protein n=1 Tax=Ancylobacter lacus TaxID=2579970 RepID=UPI001BCCFB66|nr:hypothetical protein [Ancylobacter lacus]MBS7538155.1 hypothetical protein [Ancylobacter lacus]